MRPRSSTRRKTENHRFWRDTTAAGEQRNMSATKKKESGNSYADMGQGLQFSNPALTKINFPQGGRWYGFVVFNNRTGTHVAKLVRAVFCLRGTCSQCNSTSDLPSRLRPRRQRC